MQPTEEQIKEFWEWCGIEPKVTDWERTTVRASEATLSKEGYSLPASSIVYQNIEYPPIDLNNLFKWAVPKVIGLGKFHGISLSFSSLIEEEWTCEVIRTWYRDTETNEDPAFALFWAIWKVIHV